MTTPVYLDSVTIEYYNGSAWINISAYVVGKITGRQGLGGWRPENRVAMMGTLQLTLNNKAKLFSPMGGDVARGLNTLSGFNKGAKIRVNGVFRGVPYVVWIGRIASINTDDLNWGNEQVQVVANDWMEIPANYPMKGATAAFNKRINEVMTLLLARLSIQPEATSLDTGSFTFPSVFDNILNKTTAVAELTRLANSELGYIYLKHDGTLKVENALARVGTRALDQVIIEPAVAGFLLKEDGGYLLKEDGGKIILNETTLADASINTDAENYDITLDRNSLLNSSTIRAYPVITDTSLKVLYSLGSPFFISAGGGLAAFSAHYTDPSGGAAISGSNLQAPVATTDYLSNSLADGTGTDHTADLVVTTHLYNDVVYFIINNDAAVGVWITKLQIRGYGNYYSKPIEVTVDDAISQAIYGLAPFQFDQKYQKDPGLANMYGLSVIEEYKNPKSRITKMRYLANLNSNHLMCFLTLMLGSLILGTEDRSGISNHYYITDRSFTIQQGGIINVEYGVKQNDSYFSGGLNPVTVEFTGGSTDGIEFGYLPFMSNIALKTLSAWIYLDADPPGNSNFIIGEFMMNVSGFDMSVQSGRKIQFFQCTSNNTHFGIWNTPSNSVPVGAWTHILVTYDSGNVPGNVPIIYINGVSQVLTVAQSPLGTIADESGTNFVIGNVNSASYQWTHPFDGKIFDARVYNRILTATEVTTLYNAGTPDVSLVKSGIVFQGPAVYSDLGTAATLAGHVLISTDRLVENALRVVGLPHGAPVIRANP
jgi:hypothetical protein